MKIGSIIILAIFFPLISNSQIVTTVVGNGIAGYSGDGGLATASEIDYPKGVNIDNDGNLLITHVNFVRKVNVISNVISTLAGNLTATYIDFVSATSSRVASPYAISIDGSGNYYVADYLGNKIRMVDKVTGIIYTYAGTGSIGSTGDGGSATAARFNSISCIHIDTTMRKLYISDGFNHRVRVIDMNTGIISAFAGSGISGYSGDGSNAITARFNKVFGLATDRSGNVYIGDWENRRIRMVDISTGIVTTYAGNGTDGYSGDGGTAIAAQISKPTALSFDSCDNLYFSDEDNNCIRRIDKITGEILTVAGTGIAGYSGDGGLATAAQFNHPTGVKVDNFGNLYVSDFYNQRVRKVTISPTVLSASLSITVSPNDSLCFGDSVILQAVPTGSGIFSYEWFLNGSTTGITTDTFTYLPTTGDSVRCVLSSSMCGAATVTASSTINMFVTPLSMPSITLTAPSEVEVGNTVIVNATVMGAGSSYIINWYKNSVFLSSTTTPSVTYAKTLGADVISASIFSTSTTGCYDTSNAESVTVNVAHNTVKDISKIPQSFSISPNPAKSKIIISSTLLNIEDFTIQNIFGKQYPPVIVDQTQFVVELSIAHLPPGVYIVRVNNGYSTKMIKE
jgi:hypothetical protein